MCKPGFHCTKCALGSSHRVTLLEPSPKLLRHKTAIEVAGVCVAEKMLSTQKERQSVRREDDLDRVRNLEREIVRVDEEIDKRVYVLYGLTEEEIKIVEG